MARPTKTGLDYFSFDVDFFENRKVKKLMRACGPASVAVLTCLLCNIYRFKGYYSSWDEELPFEIADLVGVSEGAVTEVITKAVQVEFFDPTQFDRNKILTSEEIQRRFLSGTVKRLDSEIDVNYRVIVGGNGVNDGRNKVSGGHNGQSKVKEIKVKQSSDPPAPDAIVFYDAEKMILENQIQFERICATAKNPDPENAKEVLRKYHLYLVEKDRYPQTKKQLLAGFEKWMMNEKNYSNGSKQHTKSGKDSINRPTVTGTATGSGKY